MVANGVAVDGAYGVILKIEKTDRVVRGVKETIFSCGDAALREMNLAVGRRSVWQRQACA